MSVLKQFRKNYNLIEKMALRLVLIHSVLSRI